jgi:hypothetical protein
MVGKRPCSGAEEGAEGHPEADSDPADDEDSGDRAGREAEPQADAIQ